VEEPLAVCGCFKFKIDALGDHLCTCTAHSGGKKAHDWAVGQLADLFRTTHTAKTQQVVRSRGQHCGDVELVGYLANAAGPVPLVLDLRIAHDRYRTDYNNNPPNTFSFIPTIASTSGRSALRRPHSRRTREAGIHTLGADARRVQPDRAVRAGRPRELHVVLALRTQRTPGRAIDLREPRLARAHRARRRARGALERAGGARRARFQPSRTCVARDALAGHTRVTPVRRLREVRACTRG
jgi:hypothetical protein